MSAGGKKVLVQAPAVGIDVGLKASRVAVKRNENIEVIANPDGNHATPSVVAFNDAEILVGDVALASAATNATNTVVESKRMLGVTAAELGDDTQRWKFDVGTGKDGKAAARVQYKRADATFTGEQLCGQIIANLKATAEAYVHDGVKFCVLTAPAFFSEKQRAALANAASSAGLQVLRIITDPVAAAIAYGLDTEQHADATIAVISMGARTCEVAVLQSRGGILHQIGAASDHSIGGDEVHEIIMKWAMDEFKKKHKMDPRESKKSVDRFQKASEVAKRQLSQAPQVRLEVESAHEGIDFFVMLSALKMNDLIAPVLQGISRLIASALSQAGVAAENMDKVVLVGGGCRIPKVQAIVQKAFVNAELCSSLNADEVVVMGAAEQAATLVGCKILLADATKAVVDVPVTPRDICIGTGDGAETALIIPARTAVPCERSVSVSLLDSAQTSALLQVFEGPPGGAQQDAMIAALVLEGIESGPLHVTLQIGVGGGLTLHAKDASGAARHSVSVASQD